jgi:phosphoserine aminotransferase
MQLEKAKIFTMQLMQQWFYKVQPSRRPIIDECNLCFAKRRFDKEFIEEAKKKGMDGIKGHRSVGGIRASIYNAFPKKGVEALVAFMDDSGEQLIKRNCVCLTAKFAKEAPRSPRKNE